MAALPGRPTQRVLVVEDEYFIADDLVSALAAVGVEPVGPAYTIDDALVLIGCAEGIDGAVLDINLKGQAAFPVADALIARDIPFFFTTGYDRQQLEDKYRHIPRFEKPFDPARVAAELLKRMRR